ncbi:MAG: DUF2203 domain-containing protein [Candidatus Latescibacterota bacterium]|nr:MAG: DUF2203 domain-containing protein [Candidatus Latescibacterota bacterium]
MSKRIFTMKEALELLPDVQQVTTDAVGRADAIVQQLESTSDVGERSRLEDQYNTVVRAWAERILQLGAEVKGLWLVDFDSGDGIYYCWRHPEPTLDYFHEYDAGFAGRRPLGNLKVS